VAATSDSASRSSTRDPRLGLALKAAGRYSHFRVEKFCCILETEMVLRQSGVVENLSHFL
jgi:hypothetical protein